MQTRTCTLTAFILLLLTVMQAQEASYEKQVFISKGDTLHYRIMYPENFDKDTSYPLVLFLHGAGERGNDNEKQLTHGSSLFTTKANRKDFPAVVIFPQCPAEDYWATVKVDRSTHPIGLDFQYEKGPTEAMALVMGLLEELKGENYVKKDQIYLMGLSMGGMGTYELLSRKPNTFAAAIAICGGGEPTSTEKYAEKMPLWAFHGSQDDVVDPRQSITMVSSILEYGGFPKFTLYEDANHNSWDRAFAEPQFLTWLFSHRLKK